MRPVTRERRTRQRGNALVEFALAFGFLFPVITGTFQFGYAFFVYNELQNAVRAGGQPVRDQLRQDNRFAGLHPRPDFQQLVAPQAPQGPVQLPGTLKDLLR